MADEEDIEPLTEDEIMVKVKHFRDTGITGAQSRFDRMRKSEDFAIGVNQWPPEVLAANKNKGKFSLTIPIIGPQINSVTGSHIQNPQDFKINPLRDGSATIASLLTSLAKHATDSEHYKFQESQMFMSGVTTMEGDMLITLDWSDDPKHANLHIEKLNEHEVLWDPSCLVYDPNHRRSGAKFVIWEPWIDKDLINQEYPEEKEVLAAQGTGRRGGIFMGAFDAIVNMMVGRTPATEATFGSYERGDIEVASKFRYRMTHTWWRWPRKCILLYDSRRSELDAILAVESKDIKSAKDAAKKFPQVFEAAEVIRYVIHHTISCGDVFLEDRIDELNGCWMFPIVRYNPYFINGRASGISEKLIGTQEMINYSYSGQINALKQMPNSGWIIGDDPSGEYTRWLEDHSGQDGIIINREKAGGFIDKVKNNEFPAGFNVVTEQGIEHAKMITGIRTEDPTTDKDRVMGAIALKQNAAARDQAVIHENWNYTQSIAGNLIIEIIRHNSIYSEDEIREIVDKAELLDKEYMNQARETAVGLLEGQGVSVPSESPRPDIENMQNLSPEIQQATIDQYEEDMALMQEIQAQIDEIARPIAEQMLLDDIRQIKKGKYNTKVSLSPAAQTAKMARQYELVETNKMLIDSGHLPIGRKFLLQNTSLPNKEEIIEEGEQRMSAMAQAG